MHPDVEKLASLVETAANFLSLYGETHWSIWLSRDAARIRARDFHGLQHLLSAFGGMGSINDLLLHPANGHTVLASEVDHVNEQLRSMLGEIYQLAHRLSKEEDSE